MNACIDLGAGQHLPRCEFSAATEPDPAVSWQMRNLSEIATFSVVWKHWPSSSLSIRSAASATINSVRTCPLRWADQRPQLPRPCPTGPGQGTQARRHRDHGQPWRPQGPSRAARDPKGRGEAVPSAAHSPDLNPIEQVFSKLKNLLRTAVKTTVIGVTDAIAAALDAFTPTECANYLQHAGYAAAR
ncbi:MAG: transposase [Rhodospirillales bacterium]|jgi:hypothetical protein|nr:transposase [Rhodospirillales bacterium]